MSLVLKPSLDMRRFFKPVLILFTMVACQLSYAGVWGEGKWGTMKWGVESDVEVSATTSEIQVTEAYIGLLGRAPDPAGLAYWARQLDGAIATGENAAVALKKLTNDITLSAEWVSGIGANNASTQVGAEAIVSAMYPNLFGRAATTADTAYWSTELVAGTTTASEMAVQLIQGAKANTANLTDAQILGFKEDAATYYVQNVPQAKFTRSSANDAVKDVIDAESLAASKAATDIVKSG